jgi:hypothetical protein
LTQARLRHALLGLEEALPTAVMLTEQDTSPAGSGIIKRNWLQAHDKVRKQLMSL